MLLLSASCSACSLVSGLDQLIEQSPSGATSDAGVDQGVDAGAADVASDPTGAPDVRGSDGKAGDASVDATPPVDGASDVADTADVADAADAGDESGATNFLDDPGFEVDCSASSSPWGIWQSTLASDTRAHSGSLSCLVCAQTGFTAYSIEQWPPVMLADGQTYMLTVWVRSTSGTATGDTIWLAIRTWFQGTVVSNQGGSVALGAWATGTQSLTVTGSVDKLDVYVANGGASTLGTCFLIDDASLTLQ
jgi:hypothetical protein